MGRAGARQQLAASKEAKSVQTRASRSPSLAAPSQPTPLDAFKKNLLGVGEKSREPAHLRRPFHRPSPAGLLGGAPAQRCRLECLEALMLCLRLGGMALRHVPGHPRALQRTEVPPGALPGSAVTRQPWPGLCRATWYSRTVPQPEGPRGQPARDRHVPYVLRSKLCHCPGHPAPGDNRGGERNPLKSLGLTVQAASFGAVHAPKCSVTLHPAPRAWQGGGGGGKITASL